jgi:hypothetical protein
MLGFKIVSFFPKCNIITIKEEKKFFVRTCLLLLTWAPSHLYSCSFSPPQKFFHHSSMPPLELLTIVMSTTNHKCSHNKKSQSNCPTQCKTTPCLFEKQVCVLYLSKLHKFFYKFVYLLVILLLHEFGIIPLSYGSSLMHIKKLIFFYLILLLCFFLLSFLLVKCALSILKIAKHIDVHGWNCKRSWDWLFFLMLHISIHWVKTCF